MYKTFFSIFIFILLIVFISFIIDVIVDNLTHYDDDNGSGEYDV